MEHEDREYIESRFNKIDQSFERILHTLEGNGSPGLKTRVALLEEKVGGYVKLTWIVATSLVGAIVTYFFNSGGGGK